MKLGKYFKRELFYVVSLYCALPRKLLKCRKGKDFSYELIREPFALKKFNGSFFDFKKELYMQGKLGTMMYQAAL